MIPEPIVYAQTDSCNRGLSTGGEAALVATIDSQIRPRPITATSWNMKKPTMPSWNAAHTLRSPRDAPLDNNRSLGSQ